MTRSGFITLVEEDRQANSIIMTAWSYPLRTEDYRISLVPPIGDQARFNRLLEDLDRVQGQPFLSSCHTIPPFKAGEKGSDPAIPALEKERAAILISTRILIPVLVLVLGSGSGSGPFLEAQRKAQRVSHASDTRGHARGRRGSRRPISDNRQLGPFLFGIYLQSHVRQNITLHA
ncbi:hypothetical protein N7509_005747 [Penicillium cosmopolitanum]|uniref:Uncharacterized protein n=1 Tax=Penicillium cosmopolitanum TaxID=1131564 RepID=A0A9W9W2S6_9EURO|nr:uncharacterized protein N7509_005747 [Penicillium cosmopolitanum]KAJ5397634.1 hypothetical protein N7509_005747 [Penicillium cosmopolitanum]